MQQFDIARVFSRAWEEYVRGIAAYISTMLIGLVAMLVLMLVGVFGAVAAFGGFVGLSQGMADALIASPAVAIVGFVFMAVIAVLVIVAATLLSGVQNEITNQLFSGYTPNVPVAFGWARHRFHEYFTTSVLAGLGIMVGFILLLIPGIVFSIWWTLGMYLVTREGIGGAAALGRSRQLVGRAFWWVALTLLAYNLALSVISSVPILGILAVIILGPFTLPLVGAVYDELRYLESGSVSPAPNGPTDQPPIATPPVVPAAPAAQPSVTAAGAAATSAVVAASLPGPVPLASKTSKPRSAGAKKSAAIKPARQPVTPAKKSTRRVAK